MRKRFDSQTNLGLVKIEDTKIDLSKKNRDASTKVGIAMLNLFNEPEYRDQVLDILEDKLMGDKKKTGRPGMELWQIFVLAQYRVGLNLSYDELTYRVNNDYTMRCLLGIQENEFGMERIEFGYQKVLDNVGLLTDDMINEINDVVITFGHKEVFKKKEGEESTLKTDSYVVETNVHYPTDYNLLWDGARKSLDMVGKLIERHPFLNKGWRKKKDWYRRIKSSCRNIGRISKHGGKNKTERYHQVVTSYLEMNEQLANKIIDWSGDIPTHDIMSWFIKDQLEDYIEWMIYHMDLLERRVLKGEKIPHSEKKFSLFEPYTEWINKGKFHPAIELGKKLCITTDQYGLIIHNRIMEHEADSEVVLDIAVDLIDRYQIKSWSFDKGFWNPVNKELLEEHVGQVIMPKKGRRTIAQEAEETHPKFKCLRNQHSAVESNINELEHRGLDRCPDRSYDHFKRYTAIGVCAYNLHKIGAELIKQGKQALKEASRQAA